MTMYDYASKLAIKAVVRITTPAGIAHHPWISYPDTQFSPDGVYKVNLLIPKANCRSLCKLLDKYVAEAISKARAAAKNPANAKQITLSRPYSSFLTEAGDDFGQIEFRFKMIANMKTSSGEKATRLFVFDANGRAIKSCPAVYGGSKLKVNFTPLPYYIPIMKQAGVSLRMNAVQILELVTRYSDHAEEFGFTSGEGSFVTDEHHVEVPGLAEDGSQKIPANSGQRATFVSQAALAAWVERRDVKRCPTCGVVTPS